MCDSISFNMNVHQASAFQRDAATKKSIESEEMAQARAWAERIDLTNADDQGSGGVEAEPLSGCKRSLLENELKLLSEKAKALKDWIKQHLGPRPSMVAVGGLA